MGGGLTSFINSDVEKLIEAKFYFDISWFHERVPHRVLLPSKLYPRVRAVYELHGSKVDSKTKMPLFGKTVWTKAKNVLKDIIEGYASNPPGYSFYTQRLDNKGELAFDSLGIALINCNHGTNDTECVHKQIVTTFGTWHVGVEMSDWPMAEHRHHYNQGVSERRQAGFPKTGMYDTWLINSIQLLVEKNHGV